MVMAKKRGTKSKIVSAAWKLFYEQGYDATTVDEIIKESGTSRGSFYHYFDGKDALVRRSLCLAGLLEIYFPRTVACFLHQRKK